TTGVSTLRTHLKKHKLKAPIQKSLTLLQLKRIDPLSSTEQAEHDKHLVAWLIADQQPFTVVDNPYFRTMIKHFCPRYKIPERYQVKDFIIETFNMQRAK